MIIVALTQWFGFASSFTSVPQMHLVKTTPHLQCAIPDSSISAVDPFPTTTTMINSDTLISNPIVLDGSLSNVDHITSLERTVVSRFLISKLKGSLISVINLLSGPTFSAVAFNSLTFMRYWNISRKIMSSSWHPTGNVSIHARVYALFHLILLPLSFLHLVHRELLLWRQGIHHYPHKTRLQMFLHLKIVLSQIESLVSLSHPCIRLSHPVYLLIPPILFLMPQRSSWIKKSISTFLFILIIILPLRRSPPVPPKTKTCLTRSRPAAVP